VVRILVGDVEQAGLGSQAVALACSSGGAQDAATAAAAAAAGAAAAAEGHPALCWLVR
jgi:hypothetical protein